jgi:threonine dehydratase
MRLAEWLPPTPVVESEHLNKHAGRRVFMKAESLNVTGSFKVRGALNCMLNAGPADLAVGVVAFSSGNHAQAVAQAAQWLGVAATIVMPADAPAIKIDNTRALGAELVFYDRYKDDREAIAAELVGRSGAMLVPPFDHPDVVAGQGTVGLELVAHVTAQGEKLATFAAPCGGGGLIAGAGIAVLETFPDARLYSVEPEGYDDHRQSLSAGRRVRLKTFPPSDCDSLMAPEPGSFTFPINQRNLAGSLTVTQAQVHAAMRYAAERLKIVVEPGGAAALAAVLHGTLAPETEPLGLVLSGGNTQSTLLARVLSTGSQGDGP